MNPPTGPRPESFGPDGLPRAPLMDAPGTHSDTSGPGLYVSSTIARDDTYSDDEDGDNLLLGMGGRLHEQTMLRGDGPPSRASQPMTDRQPQSPPPPSRDEPHFSEGRYTRSRSPSLLSIDSNSESSSQASYRSPPSPKVMSWRQERARLKGLPLEPNNAANHSAFTTNSENAMRANDHDLGAAPESPANWPQDPHVAGSAGRRKSEPTPEQKQMSFTSNGAESAGQTLNKNQGQGLALALADISEQFLGLEPLDRSKGITLFIGHLLDTLFIVQSKLDLAESKPHGSPATIDDSEESEGTRSCPPRGQVVHRIFCSVTKHGHDGSMYADEPTYRQKGVSGTHRLNGDERIYSLDAHCRRYPEVCFIIFREHFCLRDDTQSDVVRRERRFIGQRPASARGETIRIVSEVLNAALNRVAEFERTIQSVEPNVPRGDPGEMEAPYHFLFHHRNKLASLAETDPYFTGVVDALLTHINQEYGDEYEEAEAMFGRGYVNARHIEKLFRPNDITISDDKQVGAIEAVVLSDYARTNATGITLTGWNWKYDGHALTRSEFYTSLKALADDDEVPITGLLMYPIKFATAHDVKALEERGRKYWDMRGQMYVTYNGRDSDNKYEFVGERFMIDVSTYYLMFGSYAGGQSRYSGDKYDTRPQEISYKEELSSELAILLPWKIFGFSFHSKKWHSLRIDNISTVSWNKKAFEQLVLEEHTKEMIYSLVDVQKSVEKMNDIIRGKGNGLIILLHGSPGTGKTLTAESVAEIAEKPLYRVTCGDIGTEAQEVEKYLKTVLHLGKIWDCVLLLDEADVFLEERTMADLQRNSLVSVFLRVLEYYEGILILTSNRVGTFDEAFKSRIQVAIHYQDLTRKSRKAIWGNFLQMLEDSPQENANIAELERRLDELAAEEMNGRQIRNALLTARQLAKHRDEVLDWRHLSQVIRTSAAFNKYIKTVKGHSDQQWAREEMLR